MCKYCDGGFVDETPITPLLDKSVAGIEIMIDGNFLYAYCKCGVHAVQEIHFCPMCGRKLEDCKTEEDCMPTSHLIDATTSRDINSGRYPVYVLGFGVSEDDLTDDERNLWEQSKRWREG